MPIHTSLPKIEGFQPIPNAVMIPFMEAQSAALAYGFGLNYEYGKRTIRSKSNTDFNSLTSEDIAKMSAAHTTVILKEFIQAVPKVMPAQTEIFKQYVTIEKAKVIQNVELAKWIIANAPSIAAGGTGGIENEAVFNPPSTIGTTISQDAQGNVTTTQAPVAHKVELTEKLPIRATEITAETRTKLIAHYNNQIQLLEARINSFDIKLRNAKSPGGKESYRKSLRLMHTELIQQQRFLTNVTAWRKPY